MVAREWHAKQAETWAEGHADRVLRRLVLYVFPRIGAEPIRSLTGPQVLDVLRRIEKRETVETRTASAKASAESFAMRSRRIARTMTR